MATENTNSLIDVFVPGVTFPSGEMQQRLVRSLYQEVNITPDQVEYIEAHGTGTKVNTHT
jgi:fatty acid synthase